MTESSLTAGYEIKTTNRYIPFGFYFRKNDHPVYESAQRKMAVLFDNKLFISNSEYTFFMNWLFPTKTLRGSQELTLNVKNPEKWSAETPYLYTLYASTATETIPVKVGFRKVEMKDGLVHVNGKVVLFKGVNRCDRCCLNDICAKNGVD